MRLACPRFNMPMELGLHLGARLRKHLGQRREDQALEITKHTLVALPKRRAAPRGKASSENHADSRHGVALLPVGCMKLS
jgi:hypothetical protein